MTVATDWDGLMRLGLGVLRLGPDAFWGMTPCEFQRALEGAGVVPLTPAPMGREGLAALMARYPDEGAGR